MTVGSDVTGALNGLNQVNQQLGKTTTTFQQAAPAARAFAATGGAVTAGLFAAVKTATDFDKAMSGVRASLDPGDIAPFGAQLDALAISLGASTSFNALETAAAIEELAKAGIPAQSIIEGVAKSTLDLAAATGTKPAEAAAVATAAMNTFKLGVKDLPGVVDQLAGVTNATSADLGDLRLGLSQAGAVAALAGLSFTDTATALGLFANSGLKGSDAGTSLKTMFLNLQPQTKAQVTEARRLGLLTAQGTSAFFDQTGKVKNLSQVAGTLNRAFAGMSQQQRLASAEILFGSDAMRAAAILSEAGATGVDKLSTSIGGISASAQAQERLNNLAGDLEQFNGATQTAGITIGRIFMPELRRLAQFGTRVANAFNGMTDGQKRFLTIAAAVVGLTLLLAGSFVLLAPGILAAAVAFPALMAILAPLSAILGIVAVAVKLMSDAWKNDVGGIQGIVRNALGQIPDLLDQARAAINRGRAAWSSFRTDEVDPLVDAFQNKLVKAFQDLDAAFDPDALATAFQDKLTKAVDTFTEALERSRAKAEELRLALEKIQAAPPAPVAAGEGGVLGGVAGISALAVAGPALSAAAGAANLLRVALAGASGSFGSLGALILANPIAILIVAAAIGAGALFALYQTNENFRNSVNLLAQDLAPIGDLFATAFGGLAQFASEQGPVILTFLQNLGAAVGDQLAKQADSLRPFVQAVANFIVQFLELEATIARVVGGAFLANIENNILPLLGNLASLLDRIFPVWRDLLDVVGQFFGQFTIGAGLDPFVKILDTLAFIFERMRTALDGMTLPGFLTRGSGEGLFGGAPPATAPENAVPAAAGLAEGNNTGPLVDIGTVNIASDVDGEKFINALVDRFRQAARRVSSPIPPGQPGVVTGNAGAQ